MTRKTAREIAVELCFAAAASGGEADGLLDSFFDEEHYATLASENELYAERPDERQMDYIRTLVAMSTQKAQELDGLIERYACDPAHRALRDPVHGGDPTRRRDQRGGRAGQGL